MQNTKTKQEILYQHCARHVVKLIPTNINFKGTEKERTNRESKQHSYQAVICAPARTFTQYLQTHTRDAETGHRRPLRWVYCEKRKIFSFVLKHGRVKGCQEVLWGLVYTKRRSDSIFVLLKINKIKNRA